MLNRDKMGGSPDAHPQFFRYSTRYTNGEFSKRLMLVSRSLAGGRRQFGGLFCDDRGSVTGQAEPRRPGPQGLAAACRAAVPRCAGFAVLCLPP
jgi:hypothetical protein